MNKYFAIITFNLTLTAGVLYSQVHQDWAARYDYNSNSDIAWAICVDSLGNVYVTGESGFPSDIATIKYNSTGIQEWATRYAGPGGNHDQGFAISVDKNGNVYVTGASGYDSDIATLKYNSNGVQQWVARYDGPGNNSDYAYSIATDDDGNVYVGGTTTSNGGGKDFATIKYDSLGVQQWVSFYGNGFNVSVSYSLKVDQSGNVFVTGFSTLGNTMSNYLTIKYNNAGVEQWISTYNGPASKEDQALAMVIDKFSNVYVTGQSEGLETDFDYATVKYNSAGEQQWVARYNDTANLQDFGSSIGVDNSGIVFVTGKSRSHSASFGYDYATVKYSPSGDEQWVARYQQAGRDYLPSLVTDENGNAYITGNCDASPFIYDYITIKYNTQGVQQWAIPYSGLRDSSDYAFAIAADAAGNVYVTGTENSYIFTNSNYATIKYSQTLVNTTILTETPSDYILYQNYPNPFNPATKLKFEIPRDARRETQEVKLVILDVLGKEVATLLNEQLQPGSYEVEWNAADYASGIYFYMLSSDIFTDTKRMLLIK